MHRTIQGTPGGNAMELGRFHQSKQESGQKYFKVKTLEENILVEFFSHLP